MINELGCRSCRVGIVGRRDELMGVPRKVDVQRRDSNLFWMTPHQLHELGVLVYKPRHCLSCRGAVQPIQLDHLVNKHSLAHHGSAQVQCEWREILPIPAHHLSHAVFGLGRNLVPTAPSGGHGVYATESAGVTQYSLDKGFDRLHGWVSVGFEDFLNLNSQVELDHAVGKRPWIHIFLMPAWYGFRHAILRIEDCSRHWH